MVKGAVYPIEAASSLFHDAPDVAEQIRAAFCGQDRTRVFRGENDMVANLRVCGHARVVRSWSTPSGPALLSVLAVYRGLHPRLPKAFPFRESYRVLESWVNRLN